MSTTITATTPLTDEQANSLDGTLPGLLPASLRSTITITRGFGITFAIIGVFLVLAVRVSFFNYVAGFFAVMSGMFADLLGLASVPSSSMYYDVADSWEQSVTDRLHGADFAMTVPLLILGAALIVYGYGIGTIDRNKRLPGQRVRYRATRGHLKETRLVTSTAPVFANGQTTMATTVTPITVSNPDWVVVGVDAWRAGTSAWNERSETISAFETDDIEDAYVRMQVAAAELDETERLRLAGVYAQRI